MAAKRLGADVMNMNVSPFCTEEVETFMFITWRVRVRGRHLERRLRARRCFEEQVDQSAPAQQITSLAGLAVVVGGLVREIEQKIDLGRAQPLDREEMTMREVERLDFGSCIGH